MGSLSVSSQKVCVYVGLLPQWRSRISGKGAGRRVAEGHEGVGLGLGWLKFSS